MKTKLSLSIFDCGLCFYKYEFFCFFYIIYLNWF